MNVTIRVYSFETHLAMWRGYVPHSSDLGEVQTPESLQKLLSCATGPYKGFWFLNELRWVTQKEAIDILNQSVSKVCE